MRTLLGVHASLGSSLQLQNLLEAEAADERLTSEVAERQHMVDAGTRGIHDGAERFAALGSVRILATSSATLCGSAGRSGFVRV